MRSALLVSFLLGVSALPAQTKLGPAVRTNLTAMRENPDAFHNVKVQFVTQFASLGRISNPFFTQFTPTEYTNFYGWADDQKLWQEKDYNDVFGMLFLSKSNRQLETLYTTGLYTRMRCTGVVRNTFQNTPWIEVISFEVLGEKLDTAVLTHLHRGVGLMEQRLWQRAISELSLAPGNGVPKTATQAAHKNLGVCLLRMGESQAAIGYLQSASSMAKGMDFETESLLAMAMTSPEKAIDRTVDSSTLSDSERPMWEAFEGSKTAVPVTRVLGR
ncbi:MAG: hypothetical protein ACI90M_004445 [Candidatus Azotimanducaceae bacterium]|jgi:hypothetical protein